MSTNRAMGKQRRRTGSEQIPSQEPGSCGSTSLSPAEGIKPEESEQDNKCSISPAGGPRCLSLEDAPDVLTPEQARRILRMGRNLMYAKLQTGEIRSLRYGRKIMVPKVALQRWLEQELHGE
jgi:excisionase family DNA binding protein